MHETHILRHIFEYLNREEKITSKKVKKVCISLSEFAGISPEHFKEHYKKQSAGTKWENLQVEISSVAYGPELEITRLDFE